MKKLILIVALAVIFTPSLVSAQGTQQQNRIQDPAIHEDGSLTPTGNQVQNENQVKTRNEGEDSQIQIGTQEQEKLGENQATQSQSMSKEAAARSQMAIQNMSNVAQKVEELLTTATMQGGIGQQVKQIAQEQKTSQEQIQTELGKVDNRGGILKTIIGPDFSALKNMQNQMAQSQLRIQQLKQLQNQLTNQNDIAIVQETIQALTEQNTALQNRISLEEQSGSVLGWLFKLFAR